MLYKEPKTKKIFVTDVDKSTKLMNLIKKKNPDSLSELKEIRLNTMCLAFFEECWYVVKILVFSGIFSISVVRNLGYHSLMCVFLFKESSTNYICRSPRSLLHWFWKYWMGQEKWSENDTGRHRGNWTSRMFSIFYHLSQLNRSISY